MDLIHRVLSASWPVLVTGLVVFCTATALRRRYYSHLSDIPGPFWASITRLWHVWVILQGKQNLRLRALHDEHGPFVRIARNEVSVSHPDGSTQILRPNLEKVSATFSKLPAPMSNDTCLGWLVPRHGGPRRPVPESHGYDRAKEEKGSFEALCSRVRLVSGSEMGARYRQKCGGLAALGGRVR